jgi:sodium-dependent phosphate cotransporter
LKKALSILKFLAVLYLFFLCIELMGGSFKLLGKDAAKQLLQVTDNPFVGLLIGILATSIMQSSSSTTSIIVGLVAAGTLTISQAVPMIMGANIGTTITNTIVSMGHMRLRREFELAFSGAVVHDLFNLCAVIVFLPLEMLFHPIQRSAEFVSNLTVGVGGATFSSPLKTIVKPAAKALTDLFNLILSNQVLVGVLLIILSLGLLIFALSQMVKLMRGALAARLERIVDRYLFTSWARALFIGLLLTVLVQSSSVTTSMVVPLIGTGIVQIEAAFPYMVGSNIGTTITAFLAAMVTGSAGAVTIALCHLLFNVFASVIFLPLGRIPIFFAKMLGRATAKHRWMAVAYVLLIFFALPAILILVF